MTPMSSLIVHPEVRAALDAGQAVVALESTIISHGMPFPQNVEMAIEVERIVGELGAVPATIAVLGGACRVGLTADELHQLATADGIVKATTRDLPWLLATGASGATTVAATMRIAARAGVRVFATGGIGGVHRGASTTFDVSADLTELSTTQVAVVSAGIKSILDIRLTLERLETLGVPVVVDGSDDFPSFYSRTSGLPAPRRLDGPEAIARLLHATWTELDLQVGVSIATPIPRDAEIPAGEVAEVIDEALAELDRRGITGQEVTPFLLSRVVERTGGRSLTANLALVRNNAAVAARIAVEYAEQAR
ncbi:MAG: putative pseudouridine 5-phosphate glycosidase [Ilumatobacteraceae bacterium]|nr:putative pseudouridine 5-phosphate glycosidase [Ilumatobacteraceae bacterium]